MKTLLSLTALLCLCISAHAQLITTYAGTGVLGFSGDAGPATMADFNGMLGLTSDRNGNLYIADRYNHRVRKVDLTGVITTFAGTGSAGHSGDGGPATAAELNTPIVLAADTAGNIYVGETGYECIRKITPLGIITTIAGTAIGSGYSGDGGPATDASIGIDYGLCTDRAGNVYFSDITNHVVRKIDNAGIITTFAGNGVMGFSGDGGLATSAQLSGPNGLSSDTAGNIYIADVANNRVRVVNTSGTISTFAGTSFGYSGDGGPATAAQFNGPSGVAADDFGNVYITDNQPKVVRKVDPTGTIWNFAGNGTPGYSGDGGPATAAQLSVLSSGVTVTAKGVVFFVDHGTTQRVRAVNHPPYFSAGHTYTITACADTPYIVLDTLLSVMDSNTAQPLLWSINTPPLHGTLTAADTLYADTIATLPAGTLYTPDGFYIGTDSFSITVYDGIMRDTITVYLNMTDCILNIHNTTGNTGDFHIYPNPAMGGRFSCILPAATGMAKLVITDATGRIVKQQVAVS